MGDSFLDRGGDWDRNLSMDDEMSEAPKTKTVYAVMTNTDLTEGRGRQIIICYCAEKATALRVGSGKYVQGSNCPVEEKTLHLIDGKWCGPVVVVEPTDADRKRQDHIDKVELARKRAADLGITDEEIGLIAGEMK